jgi:hypothetical protein
MIENNFLIIEIGEKHLFFENLADSLVLIAGNDLHPFLETLPFPEHNEKTVSANLVESFHLFKPFLNRNKLGWF